MTDRLHLELLRLLEEDVAAIKERMHLRQTRRADREAKVDDRTDVHWQTCSDCNHPFDGASNEDVGYVSARLNYIVCEECYYDGEDSEPLRQYSAKVTELAGALSMSLCPLCERYYAAPTSEYLEEFMSLCGMAPDICEGCYIGG